MTIDDIYEIAESESIEIDKVSTREITAMSFPQGWIAYDPRKFASTAELKTALAHELGHIRKGAFYNALTPLITRAKCEYKANKEAIKLLMPKADLQKALKSGITEIWQVAEYFGVTEDFAKKACRMYLNT